MSKLIFAPTKLKTVDEVPVIFCCLRLQPSQNGVCNSTEACHRKLSHPFSQLARPRWPIGGGRQQPCNPPVRFKHDRDYSSSAQSNPVEWNWEICDLFCMVWFCFTPHFSSLAWYLGHKGTAFSRQKPGAYCPLVPLPPICNWKHTNGLAGESSMPVGLLRRPVHSDPLIPQRGVGERETHTDRERGI